MPALRDVYCVACGRETHDVVCDVVVEMQCPGCGEVRPHRDLCRGGTKNRVRIQDWPDARSNPDFYKGQVTSSVEAFSVDEHGNEVPVSHHKTGETIHNGDRFQGDFVEERRDRVHFDALKKAGKTPIRICNG